MKKTTLFLFCLISMATYGQQLISFEGSEGYSPGDINGQSDAFGTWSVSTSGPVSIDNQDVTNAFSTNGDFSLLVAEDPAFGGQVTRNTGAFYELNTPIDATDVILSFDIYMDDSGTSTYEVGFDNSTQNKVITAVAFDPNGNIFVLTNEQMDGSGDAIFEFINSVSWVADTQYNVRFEITGVNQQVFIDDALIFDGVVNGQNIDIEGAACVHDNKGGFFYFDNFRINNEELSVDDATMNSYNFRYASSTKELLLKSAGQALEQITIYNMAGQQVLNKPLSSSDERLNVQQLTSGIYMAQIKVGGQTEILKFTKN